MARPRAESAEKEYLTSVTRETLGDGKVKFLFDPPLASNTAFSAETKKFLQEKGGAINRTGEGAAMQLTAITMPKAAKKKKIAKLFKLLEKDGICDKDFPKAPEAPAAARRAARPEAAAAAAASEVAGVSRATRARVAATTEGEEPEPPATARATASTRGTPATPAIAPDADPRDAEIADLKDQLQEAARIVEELRNREAESRAIPLDSVMKQSQKGKFEVKRGETVVIPRRNYEVDKDIVVEEGGKLVIEAGTKISFDEKSGIVCNGSLVAVGTPEEKIYFGSQKNGKPWRNITLGGNQEKTMANCVILGGAGRVYHRDPVSKMAVLRDLDQMDPAKKKALEDAGKFNEIPMHNGGGLACIDGSSHTKLMNIEIANCKTNGYGGGVFVQGAHPEIFSMICHDNEAMSGGGAYLDGSHSKISKSSFDGNKAKTNGGGMVMTNSKAEIAETSFENNSAASGGGIHILSDEHGAPHLKNITLKENKAAVRGGGIYFSINYHQATGAQYRPHIEGNLTFINNRAADEKGKNGEGGGYFTYHNTYGNSNAAMRPKFEIPTAHFKGNSPENHKEIFRG